MMVVSPLVMLVWALTLTGYLGIADVTNRFPAALLLALSFSYLPIVGYGLGTLPGYRRRRLLSDLLGFAVYTYHWVPCIFAAIWHMLARHRPVWWKTVKGGPPAPATISGG
jgi:hypothetical protein